MGQIQFSVADHIATIVLDNPLKRNAVDPPMRVALTLAYERIDTDDDIRVAIIRGAGDKAFCSGGDIDAYREAGVFGAGAEQLPPIPRPLATSKPFIAAIQGYAVGGGFALAIACDLRVAGKSAQLGPSGLRRGAVQGAQQSQRLPRLIGMSKALELLLLSKYVGGEEAAAMGLVQSVVDDDRVLDAATEWARTIASFDPWAVRKTKELVYSSMDMSMAEGFAKEGEVMKESYRRDEALAGFSKFIDKPTKL